MKVADGVEMLEVIQKNVAGMTRTIYPALICDEDTAILVDTGFPGQILPIYEALGKSGVSLIKIKKVILTHHDIDHIGSALNLRKELPGGVEILAHEVEKPYIDGEKPPIKLAQMEAQLDSLPYEMKLNFEKFKNDFSKQQGRCR